MRSKLNLSLVILLSLAIGYLSVTYISPDVTQPQGFDLTYLGHIVAYLMLSGSILLYFQDKNFSYKEAIFIAISYGLLLEFVQFKISYRSFSLIDILFNSLGASLIFLNLKMNLVRRFIAIEDKIINYFFSKGVWEQK